MRSEPGFAMCMPSSGPGLTSIWAVSTAASSFVTHWWRERRLRGDRGRRNWFSFGERGSGGTGRADAGEERPPADIRVRLLCQISRIRAYGSAFAKPATEGR